MNQFEEQAFVRKLVKMDNKAWEVFCREYSALLVRYVEFNFGCNRERAEEIVQMTFVRCVKSIRSFKSGRGRLISWLKAVCRNEAYTLSGQEQKRMGTSLSSQPKYIAEGILEEIDSTLLPDEILERKEVQLLVHDTVMELYTRYRKVLILKYVEDRKVSEIAAVLGQSEKAIESVLSRSRQAFREVFIRKVRGMGMEESELIK